MKDTFEDVEKAIKLIDDCFVLNKVKRNVGLCALTSIIMQDHKDNSTNEEFEEYLRCLRTSFKKR